MDLSRIVTLNVRSIDRRRFEKGKKATFFDKKEKKNIQISLINFGDGWDIIKEMLLSFLYMRK